jgi:hypothetical protein
MRNQEFVYNAEQKQANFLRVSGAEILFSGVSG